MNSYSKTKSAKPTASAVFDKYKIVALFSLFIFSGFFLYIWSRPNDKFEVSQEQGKRILLPEERQQKNILIGPHLPPETKTLYNYSQRLEDTNNLMWSLIVTLMHETMKTGKQPADLPTLIEMVKQRNYKGSSMWMAHWELSADKHAVRTDVGYNLIAYRANPLAIEIRNVPYEEGSQVVLMRVPETDGSPLMANPDLTETRTVAGVLLLISPPSGAFFPPFTPKQTYLSSNWREEPIKLSLNNSPERDAIISRWLDEASKANK